ncbi:hypothetical protein QUF58_02525 [Anaerolineales bacterium HSG24]|nr:hypothetical protein [Anaerolineales bacterium HSG24]
MDISSELINKLQEKLELTGYFDDKGLLQAIFVDSRIYAWQDRLPEADHVDGRIKKTIDYLYNHHNNQGENVLVLFLEVLQDQFDPETALHHELHQLAKDLRQHIPKQSVVVDDKEKPLTEEPTPTTDLDVHKNPMFWLNGLWQHVLQWPRWVRWSGLVGIVLVVGIITWGIMTPNSDGSDPFPPPDLHDMVLNTCQRSSIQVAVAELPNCPASQRNQLVKTWPDKNAKVISLFQSFKDSDDARKVREDNSYDLVVWGECSPSMSDTMTLNYELGHKRKPDQLYEPDTVSVTDTLDMQVKIGLGIISYQYGDYSNSARQALNVSKNIREVELLKGNSLLFAGDHESAIKTYRQINKFLPTDWAAVYNNLGVANFNQELSTDEEIPTIGLDDFNRAIKTDLEDENGQDDIAVLAHVNRSLVLLQKQRYSGPSSKAKDHCDDALDLSHGSSAKPYICLAFYNLFNHIHGEEIDFKQTEVYLDEAIEYKDVPTMQLYWRGLLHYERDSDISEYNKHFLDFIKAMKDRACLKTDKNHICYANSYINPSGACPYKN